MNNIRKEWAIWVQVTTVLAVWTILLLLKGDHTLQINLAALEELPHVVTIYMILHVIFTNWGWKLIIFRGWLVPFPNLSGTWAGTLTSTWLDPETHCPRAPFPILLVVNHSFSSISCTLFSAQSTSHSTSAQLQLDEGGDFLELAYTYSNKPRISLREHSSIHDGAARLNVLREPERVFQGEYWTSRSTAGEVHLLFKSRKRAESFSLS